MAFDPFAHAARLEGSPINPPIVFFDDFLDGRGYITGNETVASAQGKFSELEEMGDWDVHVVGTGETIKIQDDDTGDLARGGVVRISTSTTANDAVNCQMNGEMFKPVLNKPFEFAVRMAIGSGGLIPATTIDWFAGVATTADFVMAGVAERIGFGSAGTHGIDSGLADIHSILEDNSLETSTDTGADSVADTFKTFSLRGIQTSATEGYVKYYVDGEFAHKQTTNFPVDDPMTLTLSIVQNNGSSAYYMDVDWIYLRQER